VKDVYLMPRILVDVFGEALRLSGIATVVQQIERLADPTGSSQPRSPVSR